MSENTSMSDTFTTKSNVMKAVNQYSIVVQEYFITRVKDWMESFAKDVLKVTHWFVRFEFAKGRGEIHAHILAVADNMEIFVEAYKANKEEEKIDILSNYADSILGLTSIFPDGTTNMSSSQSSDNTTKNDCPNDSKQCEEPAAKKRLSSVYDYNKDKIDLCKTCQIHKCGQYCMKYNSKNKSNKKRYCRAGCGFERTEGKCDTPGFEITVVNMIKKDDKGTKKLLLKRNNERMIQTSMKTLQSWRSNCDVQLILYESDPRNPDLAELAKVTDYVVSYACKGNCTHEAEKQAVLDIILRYVMRQRNYIHT